MEKTAAGAAPRPQPDSFTLTDQPAEHEEFDYPSADDEHEECLSCWSQGWDARQAEIDALRAELARVSDEADRLWLRVNNTPEEVAEIMRRRLDEHFLEEERRFFEEVS